MIYGTLPFTKIQNFSTAAPTTFTQITLTDTSGTPILCNYLKCYLVASALGISTATDQFTVSLSVLNYYDKLANFTNVGTSGTAGVMLSFTNPVVLEFPNSEGVSSIGVTKHAGTTSMNLVVTYGVTKAQNTLKQLNLYPGV
jgi:hypothetical protein